MIVLAVAALAIAALTIAALMVLGATMRALAHEHARERQLMLNQFMHFAGRTWQQPPTPEPVADAQDDDLNRYVYAPSQLPDDED